MTRIQFERRKRKKGYLIPLVVIILLYLIIPFFLINKGTTLLENAYKKMENSTVYSPTVEFYNGVAFLNTAESFPGFSSWANSVKKSSVEKIIDQQEKQFEKLCFSFIENEMTAENAFPDSTKIAIVGGDAPMSIFVKSFYADSSATFSIDVSDSINNIIDSVYCQGWSKFFDKTKSDKAQLYPFCKD